MYEGFSEFSKHAFFGLQGLISRVYVNVWSLISFVIFATILDDQDNEELLQQLLWQKYIKRLFSGLNYCTNLLYAMGGLELA